ncbi:hypothetical protein CC85DRAFT_283588 [Cutaneotrichosporon oleaginosum]|uniref:Secreted protein n=1 Tax=Cutaneotrichosporon oleaginosum TaxID=879819 RepID=A0A0J0XTE3_9TREE|nr:uncharacterized protein CC85DRAFT_283588 [Cutaneotrichosporon oleaginosum]KLT44345.1 hypothetical protein CC85DRAFT_283588 [Cutaneotrichosporon oleaginosum]TXT07929.1 hypothetical protein COLE_04853 [Cutaneotrichosporon oleaginosum]
MRLTPLVLSLSLSSSAPLLHASLVSFQVQRRVPDHSHTTHTQGQGGQGGGEPIQFLLPSTVRRLAARGSSRTDDPLQACRFAGFRVPGVLSANLGPTGAGWG